MPTKDESPANEEQKHRPAKEFGHHEDPVDPGEFLPGISPVHVDRFIQILYDQDAVLRRLGNEYGFTSLTFLMEDGVFGDRVCLLSK